MDNGLKKRIAASFSRRAREYSVTASLQHTIAIKTAHLAQSFISPKCRILDAGSGTGFVAKHLTLYKENQIYALDISPAMCHEGKGEYTTSICGDIEQMPFQSSSFFLLTSSLAIQWLHNHDILMQEAARVLESGGKAVISTFTFPTLPELRSILSESLASQLPPMPEAENIIRAAKGAGFSIIKTIHDTVITTHESLMDALAEIRLVGASARTGYISPLSPYKLKELESAYFLKYQKGGVIPATWNIYYLILERP